MSALPRITLKYAFDTGLSKGATYNSPHEARDATEFYTQRVYPLLRLYVNPDGKIIHTEVVS